MTGTRSEKRSLTDLEFEDMERRAAGGGGGAIVWLVLSFMAACVLGWLFSLATVRNAHAADIERIDGTFAVAADTSPAKRDPDKSYIVDPNTGEMTEVPQELVIKMQRERCEQERGDWKSQETKDGTFYACVFFVRK